MTTIKRPTRETLSPQMALLHLRWQQMRQELNVPFAAHLQQTRPHEGKKAFPVI